MKPGVVEWATNNNFAAGPDVGSPTKAPATAAQIDDGYYTDLKVAPQIWNYERWAMMLKAQHSSSMRLLNWVATAGMVTPAGAVRGAGVYDPTTQNHLWTTCNAAGASTERNSFGGLNYGAGVAAVLAAGAAPRVATDAAGGFVQTSAVAAPLPQFCAAIGAGWAVPGPWVLAGSWSPVAHDHVGTWVMGDLATGNIALTTGAGVAMANAAVQPGFAAATVNDIVHSHHPAGTVYPNDAGNQLYMALAIAGAGNCEISTSADGNTWVAATTPFGATIQHRLAYSAFGQRWGAVDTSFIVSISDDNGVSWTQQVVTTITGLGALTMVDIACDGFGDWVVALTDGATVEVYVSWDNAITWYPAFMVTAPAVVNIGVWYGLGRFHLVVDDAAGVSASFASLAGGDE